MSIRGSSFDDISRSANGRALPALRPLLTDEAAEAAETCPTTSGATRISLKVFHCPQLGHLPIHFVDSCPQFEHTYAILSFAILKLTRMHFKPHHYTARHASKNHYPFCSTKLVIFF